MNPPAALALSLVLLTVPVQPAANDTPLHQRAIVVDTHADTTQAIVYGGVDITRAQPDLQVDLVKAAAGGLDAQFFSIFVLPMKFQRNDFYAEAMRQLDGLARLAQANPGRLRLARTAADVRANAKAGVMSMLWGVEGGHALWPGDEKAQLGHLRELASRGVRYMTLTWSNSNDIGGSSGDDGEIRGLTPFGRQVIAEMNRLGVIVDVSHVSDATFWDAVRLSDKPVLASHSSSRALANVPRNMTDAMLKAVAKNGGAVCVNFGSAFLDAAYGEREAGIWKKKRTGAQMDIWRQIRADAAQISPPVPLARLIDHIEHVAKVAGVDHTCLGSDFDGMPSTPVGMEDASKLPAITAALLARGFSASDVEKILGENVLRVMEANEVRQ
ncbi:MAG TPA: dipeptidase [Polyangia bacterium]|jgi:membrane dipeptidase